MSEETVLNNQGQSDGCQPVAEPMGIEKNCMPQWGWFQKPLKNIAAKMLKVMQEVEYIQKNGHNKFHGYKYALESDVSAECSKAFIKHNIFMFSSILERDCQQYATKKGEAAFIVTVKVQVTFVDIDSGEQFTAIFFGDGSDSNDKGIYKAITGAQKYALMKTFLIATGDDPEKDSDSGHKGNGSNVTNIPNQQKVKSHPAIQNKLLTLIKAKNISNETINKWVSKAHVSEIEELNTEQMEKIINMLEKQG